MKKSQIVILAVLLLVSQAAVVDLMDRMSSSPISTPIDVSPVSDIAVGPWPPSNAGKCCNTHNIYSVDCSGSMWGTSWSKVNAYLGSNWGSSNYASLFTHGGTWIGPVFQVTDYASHVLSSIAIPGLPLPNGDTDYDDPLNKAAQILNLGYPDRTCIHFLSDGGEQFYNNPNPNPIQNFLNAKAKFQKKTGCPVCVKCYQTYPFYSWNTVFRDMCKKLGAPVTYLKAIMEEDAEVYLSSKRSTDMAAFSKGAEVAAPVNDRSGAN